MINEIMKRNVKRRRRVLRVRKHVRGTAEKPRISVFKSNKHIFAQLIDDDKGMTLASAGTIMKEFRDKKLEQTEQRSSTTNRDCIIAEAAKQKNILNSRLRSRIQ